MSTPDYQWGAWWPVTRWQLWSWRWCQPYDFMQHMENRIEAAFTEFSSKLESIETRVTSIEQNPHPVPSTPSSSSSDSSSDSKRNRRSPPELQVCSHSWSELSTLLSFLHIYCLKFQIRSVHASLADANKLHYHERYYNSCFYIGLIVNTTEKLLKLLFVK